jgi:hypothetical protein
MFDTDATLTEAAQFLTQKASQKRAPLPPKRTSSFKDQSSQQAQLHAVMHTVPTGDDFSIMTTSMTDSVDMSTATGGDSLSDHQNRSLQSSVDDLLSSTPASQSRNGSLERILEHAQSSPPGVYLPFGGGSSEEQKTPDTDTSDASLPPPPPSLLEDSGAEANTLPKLGRFTGGHGGIIADQNVLNQLRLSLKKSSSRAISAIRKSCDNVDENFDSGHSSPKGGFYHDMKSKAIVSGYGTVPRAAGVMSYSLADGATELKSKEPGQTTAKQHEPSAELDCKSERHVTEVCSSNVDMVLQMPTPEVRRKVEEWQAGVERSLRQAAEQPQLQNCDRRGQNVSRHKRVSCKTTDSVFKQPGNLAYKEEFVQHDQISSDGSTLNAGGNEEHNVKPSSLVHPPVTASALDSLSDSCVPKSDKPKWKWSKSKVVQNEKSTSPKCDKSSSSVILTTDSISQRLKSGLSSVDAVESPAAQPGKPAADSCRGKPAAKPRKGSALQSMVFSAVDFPFHGAKQVEVVERKERSSLDLGSDVQLETPKSSKDEFVKPLPVGAKPVLPAFKSCQPHLVMSPQQHLASQSSLLHRSSSVTSDRDTAAIPVSGVTITRDSVASLANSLSQRLIDLNCGVKLAPSPSVLQPLTDDIRILHHACASYVESLPPHAKFQFRELLVTLESTADCVRMSAGRDLDRHLVNLQNLTRNIESALKK